MKLKLITISFSLLSVVSGQGIEGVWKGTMTLGPGACFPVYNIELNISLKADKITGVSYHYSDITNYVKETFEGVFIHEKKLARLRELKVINFRVPTECTPCIKTFLLYYTVLQNNETLSGEMEGYMVNNMNNRCPSGKIVLRRIRESAFKSVEITNKKMISRTNEIVKEIKVDTGIIRLSFFDSGVIDNDTISVFLNGHAVLQKKDLGLKPIRLSVKMDMEKKMQEVIMVAENMGSIPPNTALMVIETANNKYELYLSSGETRNAGVRFIYEKPSQPR